jgi:O-antigen/teichoic acid export membrane protein
MSASLARIIGLSASLVSVPLTYRYLGGERYGIWMVLTSFIAVMAFADLGIGNGVVNAISEAYGRDDRQLAREYVTSAFVLLFAVGSVLGLVGTLAYPFIPWVRLFNVASHSAASEGARAFLVLFYWFVVNIPLSVITRVQSGLQKAYWSQIVTALGNILSLLGLLIVVAKHGSLAWLVFASTFGTIVATVLNGWLLFDRNPWLIPEWHDYRGDRAKRLLKLGILFFVLQVAGAVGYTSDNIVIAQVLGASAVAVYAVPQKLFSFVSMIVSMGTGPLWPAYGEAMARGDAVWVRRCFWGSLRASLAFSVPLCTILAFAGPWLLRITMGKSLHAPLSLLIVLGLWGIVASASQPMAMLLNGAGVLKEQAVVATVASIANLLLSIFLTKRLGTIGVCLGSLFTQLAIVFPAGLFMIRKLFMRLDMSHTISDRNSVIPCQIGSGGGR